MIPSERRWFFSFCLGDGKGFGVPGAAEPGSDLVLSLAGIFG